MGERFNLTDDGWIIVILVVVTVVVDAAFLFALWGSY